MKSSASWKRVVCLAGAICLATAALSQTSEKPVPSTAKPEVPREKETAPGLYVTAREAYEKWKVDPEKVKILDVRTTEEYLFVGHAAMAWNIPAFLQSYEWDADKRRFPMKPNPDFVSRVKEVAKPGDTLLVMCRSGGRSALAVNRLAEAGFTQVYNIIDGMEGDLVDDPGSLFQGQRLKNGWKNSGLPWTYDVSRDRMLLPKVPQPGT
jgi:rhodanese-related sulfurtransferase